MRASAVALAALGLVTAAFAAPALEARVPHGPSTYDDGATDPIGLTYGPDDGSDSWTHGIGYADAYNGTLSFSQHPNATYSFSFSAGATNMAIWVGKKHDRGYFSVLQDGVVIGQGDAYDASAIDGTSAQQVFAVSGLDTAPHTFTVVNSPYDDRIGATPCVAPGCPLPAADDSKAGSPSTTSSRPTERLDMAALAPDHAP